MSYSKDYYREPVGKQLLHHMVNRDAVRHATPLLPFSFSELVTWFFRSVGARPRNNGASSNTRNAT